MEQRSGRIVRQGNENPQVDIYRYVTEQTFDAYLYQLVEGKQKFASQIMTSKSPVRSAEDIDETALSYAEIKMLATGNPYIKEKMDLDIQVQKLKMLKSNFLSEKYGLEDKVIKFYPQQIAYLKSRVEGLTKDVETAKLHPKPIDEQPLGMMVSGVSYSEKAEAGQAIINACKSMNSPDAIPLGEYRGFQMELYFDTVQRNYVVKLKGETSRDGKGGTYFGATGCGKSYTMLFLTRMLMKSKYFSSPTILIITDRTDLDDQLSKQFVGSKKYIGDETVVSIDSREKLREELQGRESGGVYLTTIQKFTEDLQLLTDRTNVICISDEAHRSQINLDQKVKITESGVQKTYGFAKYLHDSLPNATYVGFTGTPVDGTIEVFGGVVDAYTMTEAVKDGITVNLVYDGRAAKVMLNQDKVRQIEEYYAQCELEGANEHQVEESQKAVAKMEVIIGDPDRLRAVAEDFIKHYETRVAEGATVAGKAMFVCSNRNIAYDFYKIVKELRPKWTEKKICDDGVVLSEKDKKELKPMEKIKLVMTRNKDDEKDLFDMLGTKEDRKEFDRQFKNPKSNFKIAIVVDMWLTGFDVPELDTIYIDKPIQQHTLIQTISRVNRVCEGKDKGLIVDYIGIKKNMNTALKKYTNFESEEFEGVEQSITIVKDQLEVLGQMFHNFNSSDFFNGSPTEQLQKYQHEVDLRHRLHSIYFVQQQEVY